MRQKPSMLMPALYGGIIMGVISGVPFLNLVNCLCCAGVMFGGLMSVFFYKKDLTSEMTPLSSGDSLALGALAGVFGAIVGSIIEVLVAAAVGNVAGSVAWKTLEGMGIFNQLEPGQLDQLRERLMSGGVSPFSIFVAFIIDPLFGLLGGLIGYGIFKQKAVAPVPPVPPPPPVLQ